MQIHGQLNSTVLDAITPANASDPNLQHNANVPPNILNTLLASINDLKSSVNTLQESVSKLQNENKSLREELKSTKNDFLILRENSAVRFPQFSKLPVELRRMIWRFACTAPQIHIISGRGGSRSRVNIVMNACSEAKAVGLELKLDYFLVGNRVCYLGGATVTGTIKSFVNLDVDTIFLTHDYLSIRIPEDIQWICGRCNVNNRLYPEPCSPGCLSAREDNGPAPVHCFAVNLVKWIDPEDADYPMGTVELCQMHDVRELLLVVGDLEIIGKERDLAFVAPAQRPWLTYNYMTEELNIPATEGLQILHHGDKTWQELEEIMLQQMEDFKVQRAKDRQEVVDSGEASFEEIDSGPWGDWHHLRDVSKWEPPKIRFVEAMKDTQKWILPPKEKDLRT